MTTAFRKVADDEWASGGVKSTFAIDIPDNPASSVPATVSPICGFGWRFHCSIGAESTTTAPRLLDASSEYIPWRRVVLIFEPNLIRSASYGRLTFHTTIENLKALDTEPCNNYCDIPLNYQNQITIGIYMHLGHAGGAPRSIEVPKSKGKVKGKVKGSQAVHIPKAQYKHPATTSGPAKITILVEFPANIGFTLPLPRDPRIDAALAATIRGEDMVDVKFYAYTRRGVDPSGAPLVMRPRPLFAKLSLLRGHSDDLDTYLRGISGIAGFAESRMVDLEMDDPPHEFDNYDYMSDSDLDSDDEDPSAANLDSHPRQIPNSHVIPARSRMPSLPSFSPATDRTLEISPSFLPIPDGPVALDRSRMPSEEFVPSFSPKPDSPAALDWSRMPSEEFVPSFSPKPDSPAALGWNRTPSEEFFPPSGPIPDGPATPGMPYPEFVPPSKPTSDSHATPARRPSRLSSPEFVPLPLSRPSTPAGVRPAGRQIGHMVVVKGHAFKTWHALLVYLYTKKIEFQTCKSFGVPENSPSETPRCSAKSMYKLADRFGLDDLKALAIASVRSQLTAQNIVHETFSTFTSLYPEIQDIEVEFLRKDIQVPVVTDQIDAILSSVCDGARPKTISVLRKIVWFAGKRD